MAKKNTIAFRASDEKRKEWEENAQKYRMNLTDYIHFCITRSEKQNDEILHLQTSLKFVLEIFKAYRLLESTVNGSSIEPEKVQNLKDAAFNSMLEGVNLVYKQGNLSKELKEHFSNKTVKSKKE